MSAETPAPSPAAALQQLTVDLADRTGAVLHGGNGTLYGLSDDGVPSDDLLGPLRITTTAQKPPGGLQHPGGDALEIADAFLRNGGREILIYCQDAYPSWPYDDLGIEDYLGKVEEIARQVVASPHRASFVYVPFNEPDWIWYDLKTSDPAAYARRRDRFLADWRTVFRRIRSIDPTARIAGPNEAYYDARLLADFLPYAKAHDVLPDVMTWHELSPSSLAEYRGHHAHYRALERANGIAPLPINIDEYANRRDLSVPGQMVQWVSMFEDTKVDADQAYWDVAGNLDGNAVRAHVPNGSWWFFHWYAGMTGQTVRVTPPRADVVDSLQGMASVDAARRQAHVVLGGSDGDAEVVLRGVDPALFGDTIAVTVAEAAWSGYEGASPPPTVLARERRRVAADGTVTVPLTGLDRTSAYRITLTPGGPDLPEAPRVPWRACWPAVEAVLTGGAGDAEAADTAEGADDTEAADGAEGAGAADPDDLPMDDPNHYATSGARYPAPLGTADGRLDLTVTVPRDGDYTLGVLYGNPDGAPARQFLRIDGGPARVIDCPSTLNWRYLGRVETTVRLGAGAHTLSFAASGPARGRAAGRVVLDRVDLAERSEATDYPATLTEATGGAHEDYRLSGRLGTGRLVLPPGAATVFDVYAAADGYHRVAVDGTGGAVDLRIGGDPIGTSTGPADPVRVFLHAGVNRITAAPATDTPASLHALTVTGPADATGVATHRAADALLGGTATVRDDGRASGGGLVGSIGDGTANTVTFTGIEAPHAGRYVLLVHYANGDRAHGHQYNADIASRSAELTVGGGAPRRVTFRNTYGWGNVWALPLTVSLEAGRNTIVFGNPSGPAPDLDRIEVAPLVG
ncbi:cellulosome protein [Allostreptomyces psammosilenae]|uniref:CBM6 domain-containing protein n=1 Tax=Allostreptomyces psammosilenae TaxID=1892865 RepID=A0A852ZRK1_9ACTN|nr:cellulosome protein [Allostreptomyces psammosilenae]NYI05076.1 hypothetical protein [Allostreptomyces psammosilenae]